MHARVNALQGHRAPLWSLLSSQPNSSQTQPHSWRCVCVLWAGMLPSFLLCVCVCVAGHLLPCCGPGAALPPAVAAVTAAVAILLAARLARLVACLHCNSRRRPCSGAAGGAAAQCHSLRGALWHPPAAQADQQQRQLAVKVAAQFGRWRHRHVVCHCCWVAVQVLSYKQECMLARLQQQENACSNVCSSTPVPADRSAGTGQRIVLSVPDLFCQGSFVGTVCRSEAPLVQVLV